MAFDKTWRPGIEAVGGAIRDIGKAALVLMMGHNGAGKTTFLGSIAGLAPFLKGTVLLHHSCTRRNRY